MARSHAALMSAPLPAPVELTTLERAFVALGEAHASRSGAVAKAKAATQTTKIAERDAAWAIFDDCMAISDAELRVEHVTKLAERFSFEALHNDNASRQTLMRARMSVSDFAPNMVKADRAKVSPFSLARKLYEARDKAEAVRKAQADAKRQHAKAANAAAADAMGVTVEDFRERVADCDPDALSAQASALADFTAQGEHVASLTAALAALASAPVHVRDAVRAQLQAF